MMNQAVDPSTFPVYGTFDAVVSGGGLCGAVCAVVLARQGARVLLVERRTALGWEVGRARRVFLDLDELSVLSEGLRELRDLLSQHQAYAEGVVQPAVAELALDHWLATSGCECLFQAWPVEIAVQNDRVAELIVATGEGYQRVITPCVVETDDNGRLVTGERTVAVQRAVVRSVLLHGVEAPHAGDWEFAHDAHQVRVRTVFPGQAQLDVSLPQETYWEREQVFARLVPALLPRVRSHAGFSGAWLAHIADEEWSLPALRVERPREEGPLLGHLLDADGARPAPVFTSDMVSRPVQGLYLAGPWLACCPPCPAEQIALANRVLLGEWAGALVARV